MKSKMLKLLLMGGLISSVGWASSAMFNEYQRRSKIKFGPDEGAALQFLGVLKFPVTHIQEIKVIDGVRRVFVIRDNDDAICLGDAGAEKLTCKSKIGLTEFKGKDDGAVPAVECKADISSMCAEYQQRDQIPLSADVKTAERLLNDLEQPIGKILEYEITDAKTGKFLIRDSEDKICEGDWIRVQLRCRNKIGLRSTEGDAD